MAGLEAGEAAAPAGDLGQYDLSFELSEPEAYRRDVPRAQVHTRPRSLSEQPTSDGNWLIPAVPLFSRPCGRSSKGSVSKPVRSSNKPTKERIIEPIRKTRRRWREC